MTEVWLDDHTVDISFTPSQQLIKMVRASCRDVKLIGVGYQEDHEGNMLEATVRLTVATHEKRSTELEK